MLINAREASSIRAHHSTTAAQHAVNAASRRRRLRRCSSASLTPRPDDVTDDVTDGRPDDVTRRACPPSGGGGRRRGVSAAESRRRLRPTVESVVFVESESGSANSSSRTPAVPTAPLERTLSGRSDPVRCGVCVSDRYSVGRDADAGLRESGGPTGTGV